jgi:hypothetical protein
VRAILLAVTAAVLAVGVAAMPATAATSGSTTATVLLTSGTLDITVPNGPVAIGASPVSGTQVSGQLGSVTVTDSRSADPASWSASVSATPFQNGTHTLAASYDTGVVTSTGIPISQWTINTPVTLSTSSQAIVTLNPTSSGDNTATWNPTITVAIPAGAIAGTYTSVITHSVI